MRSVWSIEAFESHFLGLCRCQVFPGCFIVGDTGTLLGNPGLFVFSLVEKCRREGRASISVTANLQPSDSCDSRPSYVWEKVQDRGMLHSLCNMLVLRDNNMSGVRLPCPKHG